MTKPDGSHTPTGKRKTSLLRGTAAPAEKVETVPQGGRITGERSAPQAASAALAAERAKMQTILEQARQKVKPIAKRELEGEQISSDLMNFRLHRVG
jgi:hypothetical protein